VGQWEQGGIGRVGNREAQSIVELATAVRTFRVPTGPMLIPQHWP